MTSAQKELIDLLKKDKTKEAIEMIKSGLEPDFEIANSPNRSPIYLAGSRDNIEMVKFLIDECNVPVSNEMGAYFSFCGSFSCSHFIAQKIKK